MIFDFFLKTLMIFENFDDFCEKGKKTRDDFLMIFGLMIFQKNEN